MTEGVQASLCGKYLYMGHHSWLHRKLTLGYFNIHVYIFRETAFLSLCIGYESISNLRVVSRRYSWLLIHNTRSYRRSGVKYLYLWFSHFSGETKNWITYARSVLYCWKSDRIIFSNIQIQCFWSFELPIKISRSLWRNSLELRHFEHIFVVNHPVRTFWASFTWQNIIFQ